MQILSLQKQHCFREHGTMPCLESRRLAGFRSMPILRRYTYVLVLHSEGNKGGTVVPPCDFQCGSLGMPLNKGTPSVFPSRVRGRVRVRSQPRDKNPFAPRQIFTSLLTPKQQTSWQETTQNLSPCVWRRIYLTQSKS